MAAPRLFISSTYFDLKQVRADLKEFGRSTGLDVVLFERGDIPYPAHLSLEDACKREIERCDIVVAIIGGRQGTPSRSDATLSISQAEVRTALDLGRQMFFFVDGNVNADYQTYSKSAALADQISWGSVDSVDVFRFLDFVYNLEGNNPVFWFSTAQDITRVLRDQLLGLFQDLLQERLREKHESHVTQLVEAIKDAERVRDYLERQENESQGTIRDILFTRHPVFQTLQRILLIEIRVFFENSRELDRLLQFVGFASVPERELSERDRAFRWWFREGGGDEPLSVSAGSSSMKRTA